MPIDFTADRWPKVLRNAQLWWSGRLGRPLIQVSVEGRDPGRPAPSLPMHHFLPSYGLQTPPEQIVDRLDWELSRLRFPGDAFPSLFTNFGAGVAAAFLGAEVEARHETVWFAPKEVKDIADLHLLYDGANPWLARVRDFLRAAADRWRGAVQVSMTDLGGTLDVLSTFRPSQLLLLDLYDHPDEVERLAWEIHELWFRYFDELDSVIRPTNPGYSAWPGFISDRPHYMLQCDFCYMISPDMFERFVRPELAATCRRLDRPFYHLDGPGQLRHLDSILSIPELAGVQWIPGAGAPDCRHWPDVYRKIRDAGKLIQIWIGEDLSNLDVIADQLGGAEGIIAVGQAPASKEDELLKLLARYGAD